MTLGQTGLELSSGQNPCRQTDRRTRVTTIPLRPEGRGVKMGDPSPDLRLPVWFPMIFIFFQHWIYDQLSWFGSLSEIMHARNHHNKNNWCVLVLIVHLIQNDSQWQNVDFSCMSSCDSSQKTVTWRHVCKIQHQAPLSSQCMVNIHNVKDWGCIWHLVGPNGHRNVSLLCHVVFYCHFLDASKLNACNFFFKWKSCCVNVIYTLATTLS